MVQLKLCKLWQLRFAKLELDKKLLLEHSLATKKLRKMNFACLKRKINFQDCRNAEVLERIF